MSFSCLLELNFNQLEVLTWLDPLGDLALFGVSVVSMLLPPDASPRLLFGEPPLLLPGTPELMVSAIRGLFSLFAVVPPCALAFCVGASPSTSEAKAASFVIILSSPASGAGAASPALFSLAPVLFSGRRPSSTTSSSSYSNAGVSVSCVKIEEEFMKLEHSRMKFTDNLDGHKVWRRG